MNFDIYHTIYVITNLFSIEIIHKFVRIFFREKRTNKFICGLFYLLYFVVTSTVYMIINIPILTLLVNWIIIFLITLNYKSAISKCLISSAYILIFMMIPELIIGALTGYFSYSFFNVGSYSDSIGLIAMRLMTYMEALLFNNFKAVKNNQHINGTSCIASVLIPVTTLILEIMIVESSNMTQIRVIFSVILILMLNITAFYLYDSLASAYIKISRAAVLERENELYCKQCEIMQTSTEDLQAFRHDLKNQFIAVSEFLESKDYDKAMAHIKSLTDKINKDIVYSTSGNTAIDGIINYKLQSTVNEHITVDSEIAVPCDLNVDVSDIVTILGNLLDNALYEVRTLSEDDRSVSIRIMYSSGRLIIRIANPYRSELRYENGEIVTSKADKERHGYGLKNIEKTVEKYNGYMEINHDNGVFIVDILLFITDSAV